MKSQTIKKYSITLKKGKAKENLLIIICRGSQGLFFSTVINMYGLLKRQYIDYSIEEAKDLFYKYCKEEWENFNK